MNYYELKYLKEFIKSNLTGKRLVHANTRYKNLLDLFFENDHEGKKLVFSTAPGNLALFIDRYANPKRLNTISFFEEIYGAVVRDISLANTDRILTIEFEGSAKLVFKIFSNNANVYLVNDQKLTDSFKGNDIDELDVPDKKSINLFKNIPEQANTKQKITSLNPLIPRAHLKELIEIHDLESKSDQKLVEVIKNLSHSIDENPVFRKVKGGSTTFLSEDWLSLPTERTFESINDLIAYRYKNYSHDQRLKQQKGELSKQLKRQSKRLKSGLNNLDKADKGLERADEYEKYGHLLMANGHVKPQEENKIEVQDLYNEGEKVSIPLDEKLSVIQNAEKYYSKAKNSLQSYEDALNRIPILQGKKELVDTLLNELQEIDGLRELDKWKKTKAEDLKELNIGNNSSGNEDQLPFHTLEVEGYAVWIGKNAKSNDVLVQKSHKEDIWLHARGVSGSHALIRMNNNQGMPPKDVLLKVASYAAFNSKAKGAEVVPVIITKKKYVRKPKGAPAGAVLVDKEQVEFVTPEKPKNE